MENDRGPGVVAMWIDAHGNLYAGDCRLGDRKATSQEIAAWEAAKRAASVPQTVTASGILRALYARGLLEAVDAVVSQADDLMKHLWERAPNFDRHDSMVVSVARFVGMEDQLDDLFREAKAFSENVQ